MSDSLRSVNMTELDAGPSNPANPGKGIRKVIQRPLEVDADSEVYNMSRNKRKAVIFNHKTFTHDNLPERHGTEHDVDRLNEVLINYNFATIVYEDLKQRELLQKLEDIQTADNSDCDCLAIFVLTHGKLNLLAAKDKYYHPDDLWTHFSSEACPTMAGKPKLIFINACRGDAYDYGVEFVSDITDGTQSENKAYQIVYNTPVNADILVAFSTYDGYVSLRAPEGSRFIQTLCDVLTDENYYRMEINKILTRVKREVALITRKNKMKQIPVVVSTLIRNLYLYQQ